MNKLAEGLYEEYRIIQNKIDKIADFEFKVRGWCIAFDSAIAISILSGKIDIQHRFLVIVLMLFITLVFQFLEQEQLETKKVLAKRALLVERALDRIIIDHDEKDIRKKAINNDVFKKLKGTPRTAITLRNEIRNRTKLSFKNMFNFKTHIFYYSQYLIIFIILVFTIVSFISNKPNNKSLNYTTEAICKK